MYTYDALNRLISSQRYGVTTTYQYNGDGVLVSETTNGITTRFTVDLSTSLSQLVGATTQGQTTWYVWALVGEERPGMLYEKTGGSRTWYGVDAIGSVRQTYNDAGAITANRHYSAFGVEYNPSGKGGIGYAGEWRSKSGLIYLRARWYDPSQGRFLERDPWDGMVTQPQTLNPYAYAHNQPVQFTDPSGRCFGPLVLICAGAAIAGITNLIVQLTDDRPGIDGAELLGSTALGAAAVASPLIGTALALYGTYLAWRQVEADPNPLNVAMLVFNAGSAACGMASLFGGGGGPGLSFASAGGGARSAPTTAQSILSTEVALTQAAASQTHPHIFFSQTQDSDSSTSSEDASGTPTREQIINALGEEVQPFLPRIQEIAGSEARVGVRGSLIRGFKGPHKVNPDGSPKAFDPTDFDIDIFIVSDDLAARTPSRPGGTSEWGNSVAELVPIQEELDTALRARREFAGMRPSADDPFQFRIWTQQEAQTKIGPDESYYFLGH